MSEVTIRYIGSVLGHPEPGSQITVERTPTVDYLLDQGHAVEVEPGSVHKMPREVTPVAEGTLGENIPENIPVAEGTLGENTPDGQ